MNRILHGFLSFCVVGFVCTFITTGNAIAACSATQYEGYNGVCVECADNNPWYNNYTESCGNGTLKCKNFAYKVKYQNYNNIVCMPCPGIRQNSTDIWSYGGYYDGSSAIRNHYNNNLATWSGTSRCTLVVSQPDDGTGCEKNIKFTPSSACLTYSYSDLPLPNSATDVSPDFAEGQCTYDIAIQYKNASAGYRLTSTSYGNSCTKCGEHEYSPGGNVTSCSQCPYYTANQATPPWGPSGWSGCEPIIAGFDSNHTLATQGIGNGNNCTVGTSTSSNNYGDFVAGACNASGSDFSNIYVLYILADSTYCPYTGEEWVSRVCSIGMHCSGNACGSCASSLTQNVTPDGKLALTSYNLYDAQILLSQIASATSLGCLQSCGIY